MRKQAPHPKTTSLNCKQRAKSKHARHCALQWLMHTFPQAFDNKERIRPLKLGIMEDILTHAEKAAEAGVSKSKLREAVVIFTRRIDYLACLKAQEMRIDLTGAPVSQVSAEEAEKAGLKIKKRIEKSIKNTHRLTPKMTKSTPANASPKLTPHHYPDPLPLESPTVKRAMPSITIKPTRHYDPNAVARLKEKLGLSMQKQELLEES